MLFYSHKREAEEARAQLADAHALIQKLTIENARLNSSLARYTAPRQRDAKGHFLPLDQVQA